MHYLNYNEKIQHKTDGFPLAYYYVDEQHPRYHMPFHWHRESELIYLTKGQLRLYLNDNERLVKAGEAVFIQEGVLHGGVPEDCVYECLVFDFKSLMYAHSIRNYIYRIDHRLLLIREHFSEGQQSTIRYVADICQALRAKQPGWELHAMGLLCQFYGSVIEHRYYTASVAGDGGGKIDQLKPVLEYIESHYDQPIRLDELSRLAGMSSKYFCHFFQTIIHRTPIDYLNYYRIEQACRILETDNATVTEAAYRCGFNDSSYFVRIFKKYKMVTPMRYRKEQADQSRSGLI